MNKIRNPIKKNAKEKKQKIIENGFRLMCEKGYHNVTTIDIADISGVSTGIIYQYFNDKFDIFLSGVKNYSNNIMFPLIDILDNKKISSTNIKDIINEIIEKLIKSHKMEKKAHEELMAMSHLYEDVSLVFKENELLLTDKIYNLLADIEIKKTNLKEKIHIAMGLIDNYCHEVVYHKHQNLDYQKMKIEVINTIDYMINKA